MTFASSPRLLLLAVVFGATMSETRANDPGGSKLEGIFSSMEADLAELVGKAHADYAAWTCGNLPQEDLGFEDPIYTGLDANKCYFDACSSTLADGVCQTTLPINNFGQCGTDKVSFSTGAVRFAKSPTSYTATEQNDVYGAVAWTKGIEVLAKQNVEENNPHDKFGTERKNGTISWQYVGTSNGVFRGYPGSSQDTCYSYDPRVRPWYVAATSGLKDLVFLIDGSYNMEAGGLLAIARGAIDDVFSVLGLGDRISVVVYDNNARVLCGSGISCTELVQATETNKARLLSLIDGVVLAGTANIGLGFDKAYEVLEASQGGIYCSQSILLFTEPKDSGMRKNTVERNNLLNGIEAHWNSRRSTIFTYSLGEAADREYQPFPKEVACRTAGVWAPIYSTSGYREAMASFWEYFQALQTPAVNQTPALAWSEPYFDSSGAGYMTTVSQAMFNMDVHPPFLIGVVGIDVLISDLQIAANADGVNLIAALTTRTRAGACPEEVLQEGSCLLTFARRGKLSTSVVTTTTTTTRTYSRLQVNALCDPQNDWCDHDKNLWCNTAGDPYRCLYPTDENPRSIGDDWDTLHPRIVEATDETAQALANSRSANYRTPRTCETDLDTCTRPDVECQTPPEDGSAVIRPTVTAKCGSMRGRGSASNDYYAPTGLLTWNGQIDPIQAVVAQPGWGLYSSMATLVTRSKVVVGTPLIMGTPDGSSEIADVESKKVKETRCGWKDCEEYAYPMTVVLYRGNEEYAFMAHRAQLAGANATIIINGGGSMPRPSAFSHDDPDHRHQVATEQDCKCTAGSYCELSDTSTEDEQHYYCHIDEVDRCSDGAFNNKGSPYSFLACAQKKYDVAFDNAANSVDIPVYIVTAEDGEKIVNAIDTKGDTINMKLETIYKHHESCPETPPKRVWGSTVTELCGVQRHVAETLPSLATVGWTGRLSAAYAAPAGAGWPAIQWRGFQGLHVRQAVPFDASTTITNTAPENENRYAVVIERSGSIDIGTQALRAQDAGYDVVLFMHPDSDSYDYWKRETNAENRQFLDLEATDTDGLTVTIPTFLIRYAGDGDELLANINANTRVDVLRNGDSYDSAFRACAPSIAVATLAVALASFFL